VEGPPVLTIASLGPKSPNSGPALLGHAHLYAVQVGVVEDDAQRLRRLAWPRLLDDDRGDHEKDVTSIGTSKRFAMRSLRASNAMVRRAPLRS
jgi:hypothetical protein